MLGGRADGFDPVAGVVEEIKTCRVPGAGIPEQVTWICSQSCDRCGMLGMRVTWRWRCFLCLIPRLRRQGDFSIRGNCWKPSQ